MNNAIKDYNKKSIEFAREDVKEKRKNANYKGAHNDLVAIHAPLICDEYFVIGRPCPITSINITELVINYNLNYIVKGECGNLVELKTSELMKIYL